MTKLKDICRFQSGGTPSRGNQEYFNGNIPWITTVALNGGFIDGTDAVEWITEKAIASSAAKVVPENSIMVGTRVGIGKIAINKVPMSTSQDIISLIDIDEDRWDKQFLCRLILANNQYLHSQARGATIKGIKIEVLAELSIPNIPLEEQKHIASVLGRIDALIQRHTLQAEYLNQLVKSRFIELFEGESYVQVSFGDICCFLRNGANIKQTKGAGGFPITRIETLSNDVFNTDRLGYADITDLQRYENYVLHKGDILISHINSVAYLGRAVQYKGQLDSPIIHGMNLLCARLLEGYDPTYVEWFFKTPRAKDYISTITKKAVNQASITTTDLKGMQIPSPPIELQRQFAAFVEQTDKSKCEIQQSLEKLGTLKKALMQKYFG